MDATWDWAPGVDGAQDGVDGAQDGVDGRLSESRSARMAPWWARPGSHEAGFVSLPTVRAQIALPSGVESIVYVLARSCSCKRGATGVVLVPPWATFGGGARWGQWWDGGGVCCTGTFLIWPRSCPCGVIGCLCADSSSRSESCTSAHLRLRTAEGAPSRAPSRAPCRATSSSRAPRWVLDTAELHAAVERLGVSRVRVAAGAGVVVPPPFTFTFPFTGAGVPPIRELAPVDAADSGSGVSISE